MTIRSIEGWLLAGVLSLLSSAACAAKRESIDFQPCAEDPTLQCGSLRVPIDYDSPAAAGIDLAVIRAPATGAGKRSGVLFINPGGPGASGLEIVLGGVHTPLGSRLREYFDIVSFDPRGSNRSGAIRCDIGATIEPDKTAAADLPKLFDDFARNIASACAQQNGAIVASMSTNNIARDIDTLRRALGEKDIVYFGLSFGTELGAVYVSLFPKYVRRALLDAGIPPEFRDSYLEFAEEQVASMERVLHYIDMLCRSDGRCPLATSGVVKAVDTLIARLDASPVTTGELVVNGATVRDVGDRLSDRILLLGNDFDPATPLSWTRRLARALGVESNIVRYRGGGHGASTMDLPCIDDLVVDYLVKGSVPKPGTTCAARPISFAAGE